LHFAFPLSHPFSANLTFQRYKNCLFIKRYVAKYCFCPYNKFITICQSRFFGGKLSKPPGNEIGNEFESQKGIEQPHSTRIQHCGPSKWLSFWSDTLGQCFSTVVPGKNEEAIACNMKLSFGSFSKCLDMSVLPNYFLIQSNSGTTMTRGPSKNVRYNCVSF